MSRSPYVASLVFAGTLGLSELAPALASIPAPAAEIAQNTDDDPLIREYWRKSYAGDAEAQRILGAILSYDYAEDGEIDDDEHFTITRLLECAALQGDQPAIDQLQNINANFDISETGECYYTGAGYTADQKQNAPDISDTANSHDGDEDALRARAMNGDPAAQFALAEYLEGQFLFFDAFEEAEGWYNCAAKQGYAPAIEAMAGDSGITTYPASEPCPFTNRTMDANGKITERFTSFRLVEIEPAPAPEPVPKPAPEPTATAPATDTEQLFADALAAYYGDGMPQDFPRAMELARKAADHNHAGAINLIGVLYSQGQGVAPDASEAAYHFRRAADLGDRDAAFNLADAYLAGNGVEQSIARAATWFETAAAAGDVTAMFNLASIHQNGGDGLEPDPARARKWLGMAAEQGEPDALYHYGTFLENGIGGPAEPLAAIDWYRKAIEADNINGFAALGRLYYDGTHLPEDMELAWYYLSIAASHDHSEAKTWLEVIAPHVSYEQRSRASAEVAKYMAGKGAQ
ncbi:MULTISPECIES: tetratricopeptide repeat protein [Thalassospira]|uniref:tetratricopeptide repeat protein n=1 Tax=Thalassospira TaxID=168934 RepID=UPI0008DCA072|nr:MULTISPECIES: tetratricopeptide repeat protein [Thalassospira]MDM7977302.1 tetratricopeptide repeat protein [Thalassospira xiamenensis]OHY97997.1 hypothetical protein BC440_16405 [Thalassospira sp. MIT1004]